MKTLWTLIILLLIYLSYGLYLNNYDYQIVLESLGNKPIEPFYDYAGVMNIHSNESSGSGSNEEIIEAAQYNKLNFIFITDLNSFDVNHKSEPKYHGPLLVSIDGEYSHLNSRILNLGVSENREWLGPGRAQVFFSDLLSQKTKPTSQGLIVLAHPLKNRYDWIGDLPPGFDGVEVINLKSIWQNSWLKSKISFLWSLFIFPFNNELALLRIFTEPIAELRYWDNILKSQKIFGYAGADAEANLKIMKGISFHYPSYQTLFGLSKIHLLLKSELTGSPQSDRRKIIQALQNGNFYFSLDILGDPTGFYMALVDQSDQIYPPGTTLKWQEGLDIMIKLPTQPRVPFEVELYRDGERILQTNTLETRIPLHGPGVYRVKVRVIPTLPLPDGKRWLPWIYSNPVFVEK